MTEVRMSLSKARLNEMINEATVDCCGEEEEATGWITMFENWLRGADRVMDGARPEATVKA